MSEFSRMMTVAQARRQASPLHIAADADEREAVARRFGLLALDRLEATLGLRADGEATIAEGRIGADLVQACVATGEPVPARIDTALAVRFVPAASLEADSDDAEIELDGRDLDVIGYSGGRFDLGDMIAESLALELDPYPRCDGADAFLKARGVKSEAEAGSFGVLAGLRDRLAGDAG